jgi:hypothetical protein
MHSLHLCAKQYKADGTGNRRLHCSMEGTSSQQQIAVLPTSIRCNVLL